MHHHQLESTKEHQEGPLVETHDSNSQTKGKIVTLIIGQGYLLKVNTRLTLIFFFLRKEYNNTTSEKYESFELLH